MHIDVAPGIQLTEIRSSDKTALLTHLADRSIYDNTLRIPFPYTEADADWWLAYVQEKTAKNSGQPVIWAIRDEHNALIGAIGLDDLTIGKSHRAELGYWLAKPYWGRGIMTAVVQAACRHAIANYGLVRIIAHVFPSNFGSCRVLEKCGFDREGYLRKHSCKEGQFRDAILYARIDESKT